MRTLPLALGFFASSLSTLQVTAQEAAAPPSSPYSTAHVDALTWRQIGPANMGGRITDFELAPQSPSTHWFAASAGGGLFKTDNAGTTWQALFRDQAVVSIGDVAIAPTDPKQVWVGSGEENGRNSVSWGDGIYKSNDGGETFTHMGLRGSFQIGHVEVHPHDANTVFVAALGKLWSENEERGVYRTRDGGQSWERVLYLDDRTGAIDVRVDPHDTDTVYACMYERKRDAFDGNDPVVRFGEKAGFFKSQDGGDTWRRIDAGLPTCKWGRSGLAVHAGDATTLYMTVETERSGWATGSEKTTERQGTALMGVNGTPGDGGIVLGSVTEDGAAAKAGLKVGDVILKLGEREVNSSRNFTRAIRRNNGGDKIVVTFKRDGTEQTAELTYGTRPRGRESGNGPNGGRLGGQVANKQDEQGDDGYQTGGVFRSNDRGETWTRVNSLTDRPFYYSVLAVDPQDAETVYSCGVSFYASFDGGKQFDAVQRGIHVDFHAAKVDPAHSDHVIVGCDGGIYESWDRCKTWRHIANFPIAQFYHADVDNAVPYNIYGGLQDNGTWGGPSRTRFRDGIRIDDWVTIAGGDGFRARIDPEDPSVVFATSQNGGMQRQDVGRVRSGGRINKPRDVRWNWDTPFFLSPHNPRMFYFAGSQACVSLDRGGNSRSISPDLGLTDRGTATAFAESPRQAGLLYVGTDDGALWRTTDGGQNWTELHDKLPGMPGPRYVSHIEPSHYETDRVYIACDGHRSDDREPWVFVSEDQGETWKRLVQGLRSDEPCHVIREFPARGDRGDPGNPDLLFVGTEFGAYVSLDRGAAWLTLGNGLPTGAVRDFAIQKRETELVAATHGTGVWVLDIEPLTQIDPELAAAEAHLYYPQNATLWRMHSRSGFAGHADWAADNPASGATFHLWLAAAPPEGAKLTVHDLSGKQIRGLRLRSKAGHHVINWDTYHDPDPPSEGEPRRRGRGRGRGKAAGPGTYSVRYTHEGETMIRVFELRPDPAANASPLPQPSAPWPAPGQQSEPQARGGN